MHWMGAADDSEFAYGTTIARGLSAAVAGHGSAGSTFTQMESVDVDGEPVPGASRAEVRVTLGGRVKC
jgi:hypothetical protein